HVDEAVPDAVGVLDVGVGLLGPVVGVGGRTAEEDGGGQDRGNEPRHGTPPGAGAAARGAGYPRIAALHKERNLRPTSCTPSPRLTRSTPEPRATARPRRPAPRVGWGRRRPRTRPCVRRHGSGRR